MLHVLNHLLARTALGLDGVGAGAPMDIPRVTAQRQEVQAISQSAHAIAAKPEQGEQAVKELSKDVATLEKQAADPRLAEATKLIQAGQLDKAAALVEQVANERLVKLQEQLTKLQMPDPDPIELKPFPGPNLPDPELKTPPELAPIELKPFPDKEELAHEQAHALAKPQANDEPKLKSWQEITGQPPAPPPPPPTKP